MSSCPDARQAMQAKTPVAKKLKPKSWLKLRPNGCGTCRYIPGCTPSLAFNGVLKSRAECYFLELSAIISTEFYFLALSAIFSTGVPFLKQNAIFSTEFYFLTLKFDFLELCYLLELECYF